jgi:hypothetical protein
MRYCPVLAVTSFVALYRHHTSSQDESQRITARGDYDTLTVTNLAPRQQQYDVTNTRTHTNTTRAHDTTRHDKTTGHDTTHNDAQRRNVVMQRRPYVG